MEDKGKLLTRSVSEAQASQAFEDFMQHVMQIQVSPANPHLTATPKRVVRMYKDFFNPQMPVLTTFPAEHNEMVILHAIPFYSVCAHHWVPFFGVVHVGYVPDGRIIGLSKIPRIIDFISHAPQVQEEMTSQIAEFLMHNVPDFSPQAVGVVCEGRHMCIEMRGVEKAGVITRTSALRGTLLTDAAQRAEFMQHVRKA